MEMGEIIVITFFGVIGVVFAIVAFVTKTIGAKWIWGILAVLTIGFTLYMLIESIVKSRRRNKALNDLLIGSMKEAANKPDFTQKMDEVFQKRAILFKGQRTEDEDYGFSISNPIMTSSVSFSDDYLKKLRTMDGKSFTWKRTGAFCMPNLHGVENVMVDEYQLYLGGTKYKTVYICPYGHSATFVPQGMKLSED